MAFPFATVIGGVLGLIGANKTNKTQERLHADQMKYQDPVFVRERYEEAGFNPLVGIGNVTHGMPGLPNLVNPAAGLGQIGAQIDNAMAQQQQLKKLRDENEELKKTADDLVLRPQTLSPIQRAAVASVEKAGLAGPVQAQAPGEAAKEGGEAEEELAHPLFIDGREYVPNVFPRVTIGGHTYLGTGHISAAEVWEDSLGDVAGEFVTPLIAADLFKANSVSSLIVEEMHNRVFDDKARPQRDTYAVRNTLPLPGKLSGGGGYFMPGLGETDYEMPLY